jgi:hypothetical protein
MPRLSTHDLANLIGELHAGRNPAWIEHGLLEVPPRTASDGVLLTNGNDGGALNTAIQVRVRRVAAYRQAVFTITEDNAATYTINIDPGSGAVAFAFVSGGAATKEEIADGLKAALEAGALDADLLAYSEEDPSTGDFRLRVTGGKTGGDVGDSDFEVTSFVATGAGDLDCEADANYVNIAIWGAPAGDRANTSEPTDLVNYQAFDGDAGGGAGAEETSPWLQVYLSAEPSGAPDTDMQGTKYVHMGGYMDVLSTGGLKRLAIQVLDIVGPSGDHANVTYTDPRTIIGPSRRESSRPAGS